MVLPGERSLPPPLRLTSRDVRLVANDKQLLLATELLGVFRRTEQSRQKGSSQTSSQWGQALQLEERESHSWSHMPKERGPVTGGVSVVEAESVSEEKSSDPSSIVSNVKSVTGIETSEVMVEV